MRYTIDEIAEKVKEHTGVNVKGIGKRIDIKTCNIKHAFFRACFNEGISGTSASYYTGDKSRFTAWNGRKLHIEKCKKDKSLQFDWDALKKELYGKKENNI